MAGLHEDEAVGENERLVDVVRHEDRRLAAAFALVPQAQQKLLQFAADERVERPEGFVEQHCGRIDAQRACNCHPLTHAARELEGIAVRCVFHAHLGKQLHRAHLRLLFGDALVRLADREHDVLKGGLPGEQRVALKHDRPVGPWSRNWYIIDKDLA